MRANSSQVWYQPSSWAVPRECFWQNRGQQAGYRAHHGRKKGLLHLFHIQNYLLRGLIAQEEITYPLKVFVLGERQTEETAKKVYMHNHIFFFWGHSLLIIQGTFRNQRNSTCRYLINLNNCSHFKINPDIVIWV